MPLRLDEHLTVYRDSRYYCGPGPGVAVRPGGEIVVTFRRVPSWLEEGHAGHWHPATESCLTRSTDGGRTWSPPQVFLGGYQCPCLVGLRDGTLVHHTHRMELVEEALYERATGGGECAGARPRPWPSLHAGTGVWRSQDGGATWGIPTYLSGVPEVEPLHPNLPQPLAVRGNVLEMAGGRLLVSAYTLGQPNVSHVFASDDGGSSWSWLAPIAADANETFLCETESGALLAFVRRGTDATFLNISRSVDGGHTWSDPAPLCRGFPACAQRLPDGRVLLAYGFRFEEGYGVRARLLSPEGELVDGEPELVLRDDGAVSDLGYPDADLLPDGRVLVVYYTNRRGDVGSEAGGSPGRVPRFIEACIVNPG